MSVLNLSTVTDKKLRRSMRRLIERNDLCRCPGPHDIRAYPSREVAAADTMTGEPVMCPACGKQKLTAQMIYPSGKPADLPEHVRWIDHVQTEGE